MIYVKYKKNWSFRINLILLSCLISWKKGRKIKLFRTNNSIWCLEVTWLVEYCLWRFFKVLLWTMTLQQRALDVFWFLENNYWLRVVKEYVSQKNLGMFHHFICIILLYQRIWSHILLFSAFYLNLRRFTIF